MSPGINDHSRNTGTLPKSKSNRRSDRHRESNRSIVNQNSSYYERACPNPTQHPNNLFQYNWPPMPSSRQSSSVSSRTAKNSNARTSYSAYPPSAYDYHEAPDFGSYNSHGRLFPNLYAREDTAWLKMSPSPVDSRAQSPNLAAKPSNTDKMPERGQVEGRLNQIREYIKVTSTMMDSLSQSSEPRAQAQREKLGRMVEDLYDSEQKLTKLMENCQIYWSSNENGEPENNERGREHELVKKIEESQRKLAQLQEHQAHLVGMQLTVRERLNEARQAQRLLCAASDEDNELAPAGAAGEDEDEEVPAREHPAASNVDQLERETEALRDKLHLLEAKKRHMDHLVQELQAVEMSDRASCSSDGSKPAAQRDKVAELEMMKAQLNHLKALMSEATSRSREPEQQVLSEPEHDDDLIKNEPSHDEDINSINGVLEHDVNIDSVSSYHEHNASKSKLCSDQAPPSVQQIQAVTRELKEQQLLLQTARAELRRLKQGPPPNAASTSNPSPIPPPVQAFVEKKQSNRTSSNNDLRFTQNKCQQIEDFMRKDQSHCSGINQNGVPEWNGSHRGSNSHSHVSSMGNLWSQHTNLVSNQHNIDTMTAAENLLEMASQPSVANGFGNNFWEMPAMINQPPQGAFSTEYYKQLLLGSQSLQLQMMNMTIQQCCQLLWNQQREMQSMKAAITQLQAQLRQSQSRSSNNLDMPEEHSNLGRVVPQQQHFSTMDPTVTLPPSSSLPNLVSLPNASPAPPSIVSTSASCQQQQLNNQVPPGNRANNYWDNFRSYSRQNLLSGSTKTMAESVYPPSSSNSVTGLGIAPHPNNKCNRPIDLDNLPSTSDAQYSLNLQQERESTDLQNNCLPSNEIQQQQAQQSMNVVNEPVSLRKMSLRDESEPNITKKTRSDVKVLLKRCLKVLESRPENESPLPSSNVSNSSDSSDSEFFAAGVENIVPEASNHLPDFIEPVSSAPTYTSPLSEFLEQEYKDIQSYENNILASDTLMDLPTSEQISSDNQQALVTEDVAGAEFSEIHSVERKSDDDQATRENECPEHDLEDERERAEYVMLDRSQQTTTDDWWPPISNDTNRCFRLPNKKGPQGSAKSEA